MAERRKHRWVITERDEKGRELERTCELCGRKDHKFGVMTFRDQMLQLSPAFVKWPAEMTCRLDDRLAFEVLKAHGKATEPVEIPYSWSK